MDWLTIITMAIALAMDCCAVSVVQGLLQKQWHPRVLLLALIFGIFHAVMPLIGYFVGSLFASYMQRYSPWIALLLLGFLGSKMIWESLHEKKDEISQANWKISNLLLLALATSVDVLATGLLFVPYPDRLLPAVLTIGLITASFSIVGYVVGMLIGKVKMNMEVVGGIVLILLGVKIFIEGLCS